jgi:hypothetical protein
MHYSILAPLLVAGAVHAWLPQDRELQAFNQTARFEQLGKRFEPTLPSGDTKIRGVNFGGKLMRQYSANPSGLTRQLQVGSSLRNG